MPRPTGLNTVHIARIAELLGYRVAITAAHDAMPEVIEAIDLCIEEQRQFLRDLLAGPPPA